MSKEKIYSVEFRAYTDCTRTTVAKYELNKFKDTEYLDVSNGPFLIKESDIEKYKAFGNGYKSLTFVGTLEV